MILCYCDVFDSPHDPFLHHLWRTELVQLKDRKNLRVKNFQALKNPPPFSSKYEIFTDGSYIERLHEGGWAYLIKQPDKEKLTGSGKAVCRGSFEAEMVAATKALEAIFTLPSSHVVLYCDCQGTIKRLNLIIQRFSMNPYWERQLTPLYKELEEVTRIALKTHTLEPHHLKRRNRPGEHNLCHTMAHKAAYGEFKNIAGVKKWQTAGGITSKSIEVKT